MTNDQLTPTEAGENQEPQSAPAAPASEAGVAPSPETAAAAPEVQADAGTPAAEAATPPAPSGEVVRKDDDGLFEQMMAELENSDSRETGMGSLKRNERIKATVILVEEKRVFVNLGTKAEGVIPLEELSDEGKGSAVGQVQVGDEFDVIVLKTGSADGNPIVSKKKADFDQQWIKILDAHEAGEVFQAPVVDRVKGGLLVDIGVRGFVPATHVGNGRLRNIERYVGETIPVKIIEVDKERRKVVLSHKQAADMLREETKDDMFTRLGHGDKVSGVVRRLTDYGAFVDLGGIDGLLHISEMSYMRIDHPQEVLKVGDEIEVMVLRLDKEAGRISLGLRQVLPDPWELIKQNYTLGQRIDVKVNRIVANGAFIRLPEQAEAFLPLTEMSDERIRTPEEAIEQGKEINPMIIELRPEERRMVLSLKENPVPGSYRGDAGLSMDRRGPAQGGRRGGPGGRGPRGPRESEYETPGVTTRTPTGGATIGERLGALRGILGSDDSSGSETDE